MKKIKTFFIEILQYICLNKYIIYHGKRGNNNIALTFDDGPNPKYTELILNILSKYDARATFFILNEEAQKYPGLTKKIIEHSHAIGNHSDDHKIWSLKSMDQIKQEIIDSIDSGKIKPFLFRPPRGKFNLFLLFLAIRKRFPIILWSVESMDRMKRNKELILSNVNHQKIRGGDIILFHDDNEFTCEALPIILESLSKKNYQFVTIPELLKVR